MSTKPKFQSIEFKSWTLESFISCNLIAMKIDSVKIYVCMCVCIFIHTHTHTHIYMCVCVWIRYMANALFFTFRCDICICIYTHIYVHMLAIYVMHMWHICLHIYVYIWHSHIFTHWAIREAPYMIYVCIYMCTCGMCVLYIYMYAIYAYNY